MSGPPTKHKVVRFTDGLTELEPERSVPKQEEITLTVPHQEQTTPAEPVIQEVCPAETESSQFLEHLLEVDKIENGHSSLANKEELSTPRGSTFISCRNYLSEQGIEQIPRGPHEQKKFVICGPVIRGWKSKQFTSSVPSPKPPHHHTHDSVQVRTIDPQFTVSKTYCPISPLPAAKMSYIETNMSHNTISRLSEKEELQRLNDRLTSYISRVHMMNDQGSQIDSSAFLKTAKILEEEINNLKNIYEQELDKLRKEIEVVSREKNTLQIQSNKHQHTAAELQDRLAVESDKSRKLIEEMTNLQRQVTTLESQLHNAKMAATMKPADTSEHFQRSLETMTREKETLKHRYDAEQVARQEAEDRIQQLMKKLEFNDQVNAQQVIELRNRVETSTATILSLESRIRDMSKNDNAVGDLLKSVRDASEAEFKKYQMESEVEYNRNISAMKAQLDNDAGRIDRLQTERSQLEGAVGELKAKVRSLEGQLSNVEHQRKSLEEAMTVERCRSSDNVRCLEKKLKEVQDLLYAKMKEVSTVREANVPLKAEIESLKILIEEEEKRLNVPVSIPARQPTPSLPVYERSYPAVTSYQPSASPPALGNFTSTLPASSSYVPLLPPTFTSAPPTFTSAPPISSAMMDYPFQYGTASPFEPDFTTTYVPPYLDNEPIAPVEFPISTAKYTYETSPSVNRLQVEPTPPDTPRDPPSSQRMMRSKSAPASGPSLVPTSLGQGKDYFDEMFKDLQRDTLYNSLRPKSSPAERPQSSTYHDYTVSTSSAIGDVKIMEVHQDGKFVRLLNDGAQELEFGGYMLQQNVGGHPVAVYRFPPRTKFPGNTTITVWSGMNDPILHQPPSDFVWKEQQKWGTGPECTSILCRPNGQAIAWTTAAHRFTRNAFEDTKEEEQLQPLELECDDDQEVVTAGDEEVLTEINVDAANKQQEHVYLRREKQSPPSLAAQRHPHGTSPSQCVHPHTGQSRPLMYGNDNSTKSRQSRQQSTRPDPIPGQPYAGAAAQRMGSAPLRKYVSQSATVKGSGSLANRSAGTIRFGPPTPFLSPLQQEYSSASKDHRPSSSLVRFTA